MTIALTESMVKRMDSNYLPVEAWASARVGKAESLVGLGLLPLSAWHLALR
jgi:hypothetical protein